MQFKTYLVPAALAIASLCALTGQTSAQCPPPAGVNCGGDQLLTRCETDSFGPFLTDWISNPPTPATVTRLDIPKWQPRPNQDDTLIRVDIELIARVDNASFAVQNKNPGIPINGTVDLGANVSLTPVVPITGLPGLSVDADNPPVPLAIPVGHETCNFQQPGLVMGSAGPFQNSTTAILTAPADLAAFTGAGVILFDHIGIGTSQWNGPSNVCQDFDTTATVIVNVKYTYCRDVCSDCDFDGICDEDEVDLYGPTTCVPDGIPDDCQTFDDCDFDNIPDQCDEDTSTCVPCVDRHRRMPASLLLYPEFDNRQGSLTLLTVTNTNCDLAQGNVRVELVYINEQNCLKNDFTITLTPCDTYTVVTSFQNPNFERGYVYAFAKNLQGQAIGFNFLIGNLMAINGIEHFDWSVNPLALKSGDGIGHRSPTDVDADNVRDLDDVEYWGVPERLFVPRFLGQDDNPFATNAAFKSELVLINLSGGAQFSSVAEFLVFNDGEEPFSVFKDFYCWKRFFLTEISGVFKESFLDTLTTNNLNEIVGASTHESGWFWFDGLSSFSTAEDIANPAIYGFLIERVRDLYAADLPWEECSQINGDLLPTGPFGDPRPGFPAGKLGDNQ